MNKNLVSSYDNNPVLGPAIRYFKINSGILVGFTVLFIILSIFAERFFSYDNFINVLRTVSTNAFLSIGVMMAIMLGGIDLTGGALLAFAGCVSVVAMDRFGAPIPVAFACGLMIGILAGFTNGVIIAYSGIHPFVVTLAMMSICRGGAYLIADGKPVPLRNDAFTELGNGYLGPVPLPVVYMLCYVFLAYLLLNRTRIGRHIYAVGGNPVAAKYSGINIIKVKIMVWTISGLLGAFGGVILAARMSSGQPAVGSGFETDAIAAAVLGGTSMYGGVGNIGGVFIGILVIGIISNGLNLLHVNSFWQYVAKGVIILLAVYIDMYRKKRENSRKG
ncbi:MAG: ABC transporter permease [Treponema sp.]|jgi:ribose transport system permease protein|nr:ABC transporter permease [Treponema sp.]